MGKLTTKGKHTAEVGNHPHTNMISKPAIVRKGKYNYRILEMQLKLKDQQLKTILYVYSLLYQNSMVTSNRKSAIDTHRRIRNPNTTLQLVIKSQENKKILQKQIQNN